MIKETNEYKWETKVFSNPPIEKALIGDIYICQSKKTGQIEARYIRVDRKKRNFRELDTGGFVSAYDIKAMYDNCKFVKYAETS